MDINYEELEYFPDDMIMVYNSNNGVECDLVKEAMERDPLPVIYY